MAYLCKKPTDNTLHMVFASAKKFLDLDDLDACYLLNPLHSIPPPPYNLYTYTLPTTKRKVL